MLTVETATYLSGLLTKFLVNVGSVTLVGYCQTVASSKVGDDTAENMGYATLNPFVHIDMIFLLSFMLFGIGLDRYPTLNPLLVSAPWRTFKFYFVYFLNTFLYLMISIGAMALLLIFFGSTILDLFLTFSPCVDSMCSAQIMTRYPELSSWAFSLALIGVAVVYINSLLAVFSFAWNGMRLFIMPLLNNYLEDARHRDIWIILSMILMFYLFINPLLYAALIIISVFGHALAALFQILLNLN